MTTTPDPAARPAGSPAGPATDPSVPLPYGTPDAPRVAVRGEASLEFDPEIATVSITVSSRGTGRRAALEALTGRNNDVLGLLREYGEAVEEQSTGALSVTPELAEKGRKERVHAYHGRAHISATVCDFTVLGELTTRLADLEMARVDGPWWALRGDSPAHGEARRQAVREAVARAREYAGAVGAELVALVELADPGAENAAPSGPSPGMMRSLPYGGEASAPALDLEPQRQTVQADVDARFVMSRPSL